MTEVPIATTQQHEAVRKRRWGRNIVFVAAAVVYVLAVLVAEAPPGATSNWCAMKAYFEPSGPEGEFTMLVASFENDSVGVADSLAKEITRQYGLHVIQTCLQVTDVDANGGGDTSSGNLPSLYNADLMLWGKVVQGGQVEIHLSSDSGTPITLTPAGIPDFVAKQLRPGLFVAIENSARNISSKEPPANLAAYADQIEAVVQNADWSDVSAQGQTERAWMYAAAARLMEAAAVASNDGPRAKKAVTYFAQASSIIEGSEYKDILINDWTINYRSALQLDARLNNAADSAQLAASMFLDDYDNDVKNLNVLNYILNVKAELAASAFFELYSITHSQDAANSAVRLACESLVWLRSYQSDSKSVEAKLQEEGQPSPPVTSQGSDILTSFGKNPSAILTATPEMKPEACQTF
jgi:hypothetical protein